MSDDHRLNFEIMHTESKDIFFGGSHNSVPDTIYPVKLYIDGEPNMHSVSAVCALKGETINITLEEKNISKQGLQYLFMHVADDNDFLSHYETIIIYKTVPYIVEKEKYKGKTLRFHFNGYTDGIQL